MELFEALRKKLDLVEAYWYFVEHGTDGYSCKMAENAMRRFKARDLRDVQQIMSQLLKDTNYDG